MHRFTRFWVAIFGTTLAFVSLQATARGAEPMVVVAPSSFHNALGDFVKYRSAQRPVELVSLEKILQETPGVDDPEKLKRWLFDAWTKRHVGFVLLVGDADVLPVRYMMLDRGTRPAFDTAFYPSDLYYADLAKPDGTFDDWNGNKEGFHAGYFGEVHGETHKADPINFDRIDYRPEVALGRWPVNTVEEVERVAEKTIRADRLAVESNPENTPRALFVYVPGWVDARPRMNQWAQTLPKGWSSETLFGGRKGGPVPDARNVAEQLNRGTSLVFHVGHGFDDGWADSFDVRSLPGLKNANRLPVVLSAGCSTARFATLPPYEPYEDTKGTRHPGTNHGEVFNQPPPPPSPYARGSYNPSGLGERLVRQEQGGAVAYIGCNTGGQPCGITLLEGFALALQKAPEPTLGQCWASAVRRYHDAEHLETLKPNDDWYPPSIFFQGMKYMLFGDPTLRLPSPRPAP